jgi:hypothetical protein
LGAADEAVVEGVAAGAGLGAGAAAFGLAAGAFDDWRGFRTGGFAGFEDAGAAVPRYGTAVVDADGVGLDVAGDEVARAASFACADPATASFLCILTCPLSTGPDALRFSCGVCETPFAPPVGRDTGLGAPAGGACLETVACVFAPVRSIIDMMSLRD